MSRITWKQKTRRNENGKSAYLGKIKIGSVDWDSCRSDINLPYKITFLLPQCPKIKNRSIEEEAQIKFEEIIIAWFKAAGIINE